MRSTRLLVVRHARTRSTGEGDEAWMTGRTELPLDELGRRQAAALASALRAESVGAIYTSPLLRALDTATPSARELGLAPERCSDLAEMDCGEADGLPIREVKLRFPDSWIRHEERRHDDFRWPGGESYDELRRRALDATGAIARAHPGETVVVVTHAGVVSQLCGHLCGLPPARWDCYRPGNCGITVIEWRGGSAALVAFDDPRARSAEAVAVEI